MKAEKTLFFLVSATIILMLTPIGIATASGESHSSTPQQVFDGMRKSFRPEKAKGVNARYQFDLNGPNGGEWYVDVNDGTMTMARGRIDHPHAGSDGRLEL